MFVGDVRKSRGNESVAIGHLNLWQCLFVQHIAFLDDAALEKKERRQSINFVRGEGSALAVVLGQVFIIRWRLLLLAYL